MPVSVDRLYDALVEVRDLSWKVTVTRVTQTELAVAVAATRVRLADPYSKRA